MESTTTLNNMDDFIHSSERSQTQRLCAVWFHLYQVENRQTHLWVLKVMILFTLSAGNSGLELKRDFWDAALVSSLGVGYVMCSAGENSKLYPYDLCIYFPQIYVNLKKCFLSPPNVHLYPVPQNQVQTPQPSIHGPAQSHPSASVTTGLSAFHAVGLPLLENAAPLS